MAAYGDMDTEGLHKREAGLGRVGLEGRYVNIPAVELMTKG